MSLRKIAGLLVAFGLVVGLIGGAGATFLDTATASQQINVGTFGISLDSSTPGALVSADGKTLTCPAVPVLNSAGPTLDGGPWVKCNLQIKSTGTIKPAQVSLKMAAAATVGTPTLAHFGIEFTGPGATAGFFFLKTSSQTLANTFTLPASYDANVDWGQFVGNGDGLDNGDLGATIVVTYSVEAFQ